MRELLSILGYSSASELLKASVLISSRGDLSSELFVHARISNLILFTKSPTETKYVIKYNKLYKFNNLFFGLMLLANRHAVKEVRVGRIARHRRLLVVGEIGRVRVRRRTLAVPSDRQ